MLLNYILFAGFEMITRGQKQRGDPQEKRYINPDPERIVSKCFPNKPRCTENRSPQNSPKPKYHTIFKEITE